VISSDRVFVAAPAKINLCLHVGEKRADGYHDLESLVAFAGLGDEIVLAPGEDISLQLDGPFGSALAADESNLALRAARLLAESAHARAGARIRLTKNIPVAAGLGGGSADAAAVLRGLVRLWNLPLDRSIRREIAAVIGADVPVCIDSAAAWMEGRGERVTPLPALPSLWLLLANPRVAVPTAQVFAMLRERRGLGMQCPLTAFEDACAVVHFLRSTTNDLEAPALAFAPVIGDVLEEMRRLPGVPLARMSGSGATCFGLFAEEQLCSEATAALRQRRPEWWIESTTLASAGATGPKLL
jgi:4-diphosphocytidyl-2-C-methyl-D-erythritol kinase